MKPTSTWAQHDITRITLTLALAAAGAALCVWLRTPIPWMIGPLLATALASVLGAPTRSRVALRDAGQAVIGCALGLYFTPQVGALVLGLWWAIVLCIAWALLLGVLFGAWLYMLNARALPGLDRATTYFASAIGGASEMTLIAERVGARTDLVAAAHSMRVLIVVLMVPFGMQFSGLQGIDVPAVAREVRWPGLALLLGLAAAGGWVAQRLRRTNPWFLGSLLVTMVLTLADVQPSAMPAPLSNAAQLVIGVSLGVRFTPEFVHAAPRWLATVALGTVLMLGLCVGFAFVMSHYTGLHAVTMILGTSPGGIAEMAITAKVLQLGVPMVTAFQACRLLAVLVLVQPVYRWWVARP